MCRHQSPSVALLSALAAWAHRPASSLLQGAVDWAVQGSLQQPLEAQQGLLQMALLTVLTSEQTSVLLSELPVTATEMFTIPEEKEKESRKRDFVLPGQVWMKTSSTAMQQGQDWRMDWLTVAAPCL